jgi:hypothetical protein
MPRERELLEQDQQRGVRQPQGTLTIDGADGADRRRFAVDTARRTGIRSGGALDEPV